VIIEHSKSLGKTCLLKSLTQHFSCPLVYASNGQLAFDDRWSYTISDRQMLTARCWHRHTEGQEKCCVRLFKRHVLPSDLLLNYLLTDRRNNDSVNSFIHYELSHVIWK